ncbi:MAG: Ig-like domain-containing protein, partial [Chloroflexi bacterium]|nr:Ig-like domain-containing protein [Chloroflexota bacterium]
MNRLRRTTWPVLGLALLLLLMVAGSVLAQDGAQNGEDQYPPNVIDVWPYPGEELLTNQPVTVTFDQAMDAASVEAAWQTEPAAPAQFNWLDTRTVEVLPEGGWQRATRYAVTIGTGATAANGLTLEAPYEFIVQSIGYLEVAAVIPAPDAEGITADATITVSFNRPVVPLVSTDEIAGLPDPLTFEPAIAGTGEWINTSIYVFTPEQPLSGGTTFTASIPAGLTDVTGSTLDETYSWQFRTLPPEILNVNPYQNQTQIRLDRTITVEFSQPMDIPSTEAAFSLQYNGE